MSKSNGNNHNTKTTTTVYYDQNKANLIRLKVNKVNLIQKLVPDDEFITKLINSKILSYEDAAEIMNGRNREEKAKNLINLLLSKNDNPNSDGTSGRTKSIKKDWYHQFRNALLEKNYTELVTYLDNTIINKPKFVEKFSSLSVNNSQKRVKNESKSSLFSTESIDDSNRIKTIMKPHHQQSQSKSFKYKIRPSYLLDELKVSKDANDLKQLTAEREAFELFKQLEKLSYDILTPSGTPTLTEDFILDTPIVKSILDLADCHLYIKYFKYFNDGFKVDILKEFNRLMVENFNKDKIIRLRFYGNLDELVHKLAWTFIRNEKSSYANEMLDEYLNYIEFLENYVKKLNKENNNLEKLKAKNLNDNSRFILLIGKLNTISNLIIVKNSLFDFTTSIALNRNAKELLGLCDQYEMEVNTTILFYGIANTYYEVGNFEKASISINKSLLTVCYENDLLIEILGTASLIYSLKWNLKEAENFAILAVQSARAIYGVNHSQFVRALLHYCYFSNELFKTTRLSIFYTLNLAKKVYGCNCLAIADAYRSLSKALTVNKYFKEDIYFDYAQKSLKIATGIINCEDESKNSNISAKLIPYKLAFVSALQWRSINSEENEMKQVYLNEAYNLCIDALKSNVNLLGQVNIYSAKIYRLIGSLLYYMEKDLDSEKIHKKSVDILESILPPNNFHCLLAKSTLGVFYKMIGSVDDAISSLLEVTSNLKQDEVQNIAGYCKWIPSIYSNLSECYKIKKLDELSANYQKQAENLRIISHKSNNKFEIEFEMYRNPPSDLNEYLKELIK